MNENFLEIRDYDGEGYRPLIDYGEWRVAILRFLDAIQPEKNKSMERHTETDEVFVLTRGRGVLIMGGNALQVDGIYPQAMEIGTIYNVKRNAWHTILLSRNASVLIIENRNTGEHNSEYANLSTEQHRLIVETARREKIE